MAAIPEFGNSELWVVKTTLRERYGREIEVQMADAEVRIRPNDRDLATCPAVYWEGQSSHFVLLKTGDRRYRCQFYYRLHQQFGTGKNEYDDLTECLIDLLHTEADHALKQPE